MTVVESQHFGAAKFPVLNALLDEAGIKLVDIGGRGSALPALLCLAPFSGYYVSEPDREEAERLQQHLPRRAPWRTVTVFAARSRTTVKFGTFAGFVRTMVEVP